MIITSSYKEAPDEKLLGGKGKNLVLLKQSGYPVPDFIIIPADAFNNSGPKLLTEEIPASVKRNFPEKILFAVRSSAVGEDSTQLSFAGQFKTVLNVSIEDLVEKILEVWNSASGDNINAYLHYAQQEPIRMAVIIQQMIPSSASGIAFGINPLTGNKNEQVINAIEGIGEALVSGHTNADSYTITNNKITDRQIVNEQPVLSEKQVLEVAGQLQKLTNLYGCPQDIEFAFYNEQFYLLQSRPVTTIGIERKKIVWDNSNIIESYPGTTLPLTFSFIEKMYEAVYRQLSHVFGIRTSLINRNSEVYANMLGLLNGRVYYNLNSWHKALSLLPSYNLNADFMDKMMGVKEKAGIEVDAPKKAVVSDYMDAVRAIGSILKNLATVRKQKTNFINDFDKVYQHFKHKDYANSSLTEILTDYKSFEQTMVSKWKAPLVNDFFAMIYFGLLQKLCSKYFPDDHNIHNELIAFSHDIITTEPIRLLPQLLTTLSSEKELDKLLQEGTATDVLQTLNQPHYTKQLMAFNDYIDKWGDRSIAELKLETITYTQEPVRLISLLQSYRKNGIKQAEQAGNNNAAGEKVRQKLASKPVTKLLFNHVLRNARYLVSNRENLRYYRTLGFGMVRRMMLAFGKKAEVLGLLNDKRDIFYLQFNELDEIVNGAYTPETLKKLIDNRKEEYKLYEQLTLPERVTTYGKPGKVILTAQQDKNKSETDELKGIPCSPGVVKTKVHLLNYADQLQTLDGNIMATYATDPGWVVLFPSAGGIITERGSLLSHAAIVSREMGIPCIVGIAGLMNTLHDGDEIIMDGSTGIVKIIHKYTTEQ